MSRAQWWGRVQGDEPDAPLHLMVDVPQDVLRRSVCTMAVGTGYARAASDWKPGERCTECLALHARTV